MVCFTHKNIGISWDIPDISRDIHGISMAPRLPPLAHRCHRLVARGRRRARGGGRGRPARRHGVGAGVEPAGEMRRFCVGTWNIYISNIYISLYININVYPYIYIYVFIYTCIILLVDECWNCWNVQFGILRWFELILGWSCDDFGWYRIFFGTF